MEPTQSSGPSFSFEAWKDLQITGYSLAARATGCIGAQGTFGKGYIRISLRNGGFWPNWSFPKEHQCAFGKGYIRVSLRNFWQKATFDPLGGKPNCGLWERGKNYYGVKSKPDDFFLLIFEFLSFQSFPNPDTREIWYSNVLTMIPPL